MGMYTGLRFKGIIKLDYRDDISKVLDSGEWDQSTHEVLKEFSYMARSFMIPFGSLSYMPDCWEIEDSSNSECYATDGFEMFFNKETGLFCFQCSLKNYGDTIGSFIYDVIPVICESLIHCEKLYEEWGGSELYVLENSEIDKSPYGITYDLSDMLGGIDATTEPLAEEGCASESTYIPYKQFDHTRENIYR